MINTFRLRFTTDENSKATITVPHADPGKTDAQVKTAMEQIVAAGIVRMSAGRLTGPDSASLMAVTDTELNVK